MNTYILKARKIEVTDRYINHTDTYITDSELFDTEYYYGHRPDEFEVSETEIYFECPVIDGLVHKPDCIQRWNPIMEWFE